MGHFLNPPVLCHGSIWWRRDIVTAAARDQNLVAGVSVRKCSVQLANINLVVEFLKRKSVIQRPLYVGTQVAPVTKFAVLIRNYYCSWVGNAPTPRFITTLWLLYVFFNIIIVIITWMISVNEIKGSFNFKAYRCEKQRSGRIFGKTFCYQSTLANGANRANKHLWRSTAVGHGATKVNC